MACQVLCQHAVPATQPPKGSKIGLELTSVSMTIGTFSDEPDASNAVFSCFPSMTFLAICVTQ